MLLLNKAVGYLSMKRADNEPVLDDCAEGRLMYLACVKFDLAGAILLPHTHLGVGAVS